MDKKETVTDASVRDNVVQVDASTDDNDAQAISVLAEESAAVEAASVTETAWVAEDAPVEAVEALDLAGMPAGEQAADMAAEIAISVALVGQKSSSVQTAVQEPPFPKNLYHKLGLCTSQHGKAYASFVGKTKNACNYSAPNKCQFIFAMK